MSGTPFAVAERAHAYVRVADDLREKIRSGTLTAGARLPAHRVMAEEYDDAVERLLSGCLPHLEGELAPPGLVSPTRLQHPEQERGRADREYQEQQSVP
ncbi:GntR family transcriptional regulator [Nonomuraea sp. NPDC048892]|uniref:GntR family transcriptional regulator n=1 Tax=Nonomuraea sp. NPDC048892 TaxID=3154624 RepID=UPI0033D1E132